MVSDMKIMCIVYFQVLKECYQKMKGDIEYVKET